jgi:uncharacterized repeat protein (TIGR03943 family)
MVVALSAAGGTISLLIGAVLLRLTFTGTYSRYVRVGMGPWLAVAGAAVVLLGLATLLRALRRSHAVDEDIHDHGGNRVGWLLLAPIAALLLVAPPTLGSYGVGRGATVDVRAGAPIFDDLRAGTQPVPMTLLEFGQRAFERGGASFNGAEVELTGFVALTEEGGFELARYQIACCAADATPMVIRVTGVFGDVPTQDRWVSVTGVFQPGGDPVPRLAATSVLEIPPPNDPYE